MSLKKRLVNNGLASLIQKGIRILEQLFLVPFFILAWGAAYYGEWITLTIIPTVIAFSDFGFGSAAANGFVLAYASGDKQRAANINSSGIYIIGLMILFATLISIMSMFGLTYFHVFDKSLINTNDAIVSVSLLILARVLNFYTQLFQAYFRAAQKAAMSINFITAKSALNLGSGLVVLLLGYGVVAFALSQLIVIIFFLTFFWWKGRRVLGLYKEYKGERDKNEYKIIINKGLGYLLSPIWQALYFQGTTFIVRIVLGPEAVAVFNTVRTLSRSLNQILFMVKTTVYPELQFELGIGNFEKAKKLYRVSILSVFLISMLGFLGLMFGGLWFYAIWTNNQLEVPAAMWYIFISGMLFNALWWTAEMIFSAVNQPNKFAIYGLTSAIISIIFTYVFSLLWGLTGAAIGALTLDVIMMFITIPMASKILSMNSFEIFTHGFNDFKVITKQIKGKIIKS